MTKHFMIWMLLGALTQGSLQAAEETRPAFAFPAAQAGGSARAIGMGSTYVGVAEGSAALLWNPAGLGSLAATEVSVNHMNGLVGSTQEIVLLGVPLGYGNGLGAGFNFEDQGTFEGRDASGNRTGDYAVRSYGASLGWGMSAPEGFAVGLGLKANRQDLAGNMVDSVAGDLGALWSQSRELTVGVAYTNLGPDVQGRPLAQGLRVGLSSLLTANESLEWLLALSGQALTRGDESLHAGVEAVFSRQFALRAGYGASVQGPQASSSSLLGWSFGGGVMLAGLALDYAYVPLETVGDLHRISLTYAFYQPNRTQP